VEITVYRAVTESGECWDPVQRSASNGPPRA